MIALAHLSMLTQAAKGEFRMQADDAEARQTWLISFIRTGQGIVNDEDRNLARLINNAIGTQFEMLNTQPDAA
jgi:hypothetical protein